MDAGSGMFFCAHTGRMCNVVLGCGEAGQWRVEVGKERGAGEEGPWSERRRVCGARGDEKITTTSGAKTFE
jgi:hypothetical protein